MSRRFRDRVDAGRALAEQVVESVPGIRGESGEARPLVLGLPRGGVPVAAEVAAAIDGDLDVLTVRKIGAPYHEELAIGAVASGGLTVLNDHVISQLGIPDRMVEQRAEIARRELAEQETRFRADRPRPDLAGRTVVIVDDGLATGATMRAAVGAVRGAGPKRIIVAVPVGAPDSCAQVTALADQLVCPMQPRDFSAVGQWYADFSATTDADVISLLAAHH
jgi:predicted phosphoribosyltransferase